MRFDRTDCIHWMRHCLGGGGVGVEVGVGVGVGVGVEKIRKTTFRGIKINVPGKIRIGIRFEILPGRLS